MEQKFLATWATAREQAQKLGVRFRPTELTLAQAKRALSGTRDSDGFGALCSKDRLDLSLEALAVDKQYTSLFSDEEANNALMRLLDAGYRF